MALLLELFEIDQGAHDHEGHGRHLFHDVRRNEVAEEIGEYDNTLIMLVSALYGYEKTMHAYEVAVAEKYRFFSFGDAMLIL